MVEADPAIGRKIKGYLITGLLGRGGMGAVYRAEHPLIGKKIAIKMLQGESAQNQQAIARFLQEAKAVNDIHHENVVDILDFDQTPEGEHFILMEHLEGLTLTSVLSTDAPFPPERMGHIGLQICSALEAAHQKGIIHRDLKSDNVFLTTRTGLGDFVKILDFGIAKLLDNQNDMMATGKDVFLGSPSCMSPEQALGTPVSARTDIYGLGTILYQMATGVAPFYDANPLVLVTKHIMNAPTAPRQKNPALSEELDALIRRCLEKKPEDRYASMEALAEELGRACQLDAASYLRKSAKLVSSVRIGAAAPSYADLSFRASNTGIGPAPVSKNPSQEDLLSTITEGVPTPWKEPVAPAPAVRPSDTLPKGERSALPLPRPSRKTIVWVAGGLFLLLVALGVSFSLGLFSSPPPPSPVVASQPAIVLKAPETQPASDPVPAAPGFLSVSISPPVQCFIDGELIGKTPIKNHSLPAGEHTVQLVLKQKPKPIEQTFTIEIKSGAPTKLVKKLNIKRGLFE